jgi:predicted transcriptional regulator
MLAKSLGGKYFPKNFQLNSKRYTIVIPFRRTTMQVKQTTVPVAVKLPIETRDRLQVVATKKDRSAHWIMREAIKQYLEREELQLSLLADAQKAWKNYQTTGLHVTMTEADQWLSELENGNNVEPPECHV